jgi:hypothetical protein
VGTTRGAARAAALLLPILLTACGGGGGGGSDSGGGGSASSTSIAVSPDSLSFKANQFGSPPPAQSVVATYQGDGVIAGYPPDQGNPGWLSISAAGSGTNSPVTFNLAPLNVSLAPGVYHTTVRFLTGHADGTDLKYKDVAVTYEIAGRFATSTNELDFVLIKGDPAQTRQIAVIKDDGRYSATSNQPWLIVEAAPQASGGAVNVTVDPAALSQPSQTGVVTITDDSQGIAPLQVTVVAMVRNPNLSTNPTSVNISAVSDQTTVPAALALAIQSETAAPINFTAAVSYEGSTSGWLNAIASGTTNATRNVQPTTTTLAPGGYSATLTLTPDNGMPVISVPIQYSLRAANLVGSRTSLNYSVDTSTTAAALTQAVGLSDDGAPLSWTATASAPWLVLDNTAGTTGSGTGFNASLDQTQLANLANGSYSATVSVSYHSASTVSKQLVIPVSLSVALPTVTDVVPAVTETNASLPHLLHGNGFASITNQTAHVGDQTIATIEVLSDDLARVTVPALAAGNYTVRVDNNIGLARAGGSLTVMTTPVYTATSIARANNSLRVLYDPLHQTVYSLDLLQDASDHGSIVRYRYQSGAWQQTTLLTDFDLFDIDLSADGNTIYLAIDNKLYTLDLTDSSASIVQIASIDGTNLSIGHINLLADGRLLLVERGSGSNSLATLLLDPNSDSLTSIGSVLCGLSASSGDRSRVLIAQACASPAGSVNYVDAAVGQMHTSSYNAFISQNEMAADRTGTHAVIDSHVLDHSFNVIATLNSVLYGSSFSPESSRLYGVTQPSGGASNAPLLTVYDTSGNPSAGQFPLLTTYPIPGAHDNTGTGAYMVVAPNMSAALIIKSDQFVVVPLQ